MSSYIVKTFFVVVGFQALFHDFARWHVLEGEFADHSGKLAGVMLQRI